MYKIENQVRVREKTDTTLYSWAIQERNPKTKEVYSDKIPWHWSFRFYIEQVNTLTAAIFEDGEKKSTLAIIGTMKPLPNSRWSPVIFSFFGTDREIERFTFRIYQVEEDKDEYTYLGGAPSFDYEVDFRNKKMDDFLELSVGLKPSRFEPLYNRIHSGNEFQATVYLKGVSGFYSDWSPEIKTDDVKVLDNIEHQKILMPDGCTVAPPILGKVEHFDFTVIAGPGAALNDPDGLRAAAIDIEKNRHERRRREPGSEDEYREEQTPPPEPREKTDAEKQTDELTKIYAYVKEVDKKIGWMSFGLFAILICTIYIAF